MPRPWVVRAGDGRLATTRRPFRFYGWRKPYIPTMKPLHILVFGQDASQRDELLGVLRAAGHQAVAAVSPSSVAAALSDAEFDTVVLDLAWPDLDLTFLRRAVSPTHDGEPESLEAAERRHLALVLRHTSGNKRQAAHLLGISRSTLLNKVRKYGLEERPSR
jgi:DNA-binding NtrC family response regulator